MVCNEKKALLNLSRLCDENELYIWLVQHCTFDNSDTQTTIGEDNQNITFFSVLRIVSEFF